MAAKKATSLGLLRRFSEGKDVNEYLKTEYRQNLKTIESWRKEFENSQAQGGVDSSATFCYFTSQLTSQPILDVQKSPDVTSITRQSTGNYLIQLNRPFSDVSFIDFYLKLGSGVPAMSFMFIRSIDTVNREILVEFVTGGSVPQDPQLGAFLGIKIYLTEE